MKSLFITLISLSAALQACAEKGKTSNLAPHSTEDFVTHDISWKTQSCMATAKNEEVTLSTNGKLSGGKLMFRLNTHIQLEELPRVLLTSSAYFHPEIEGTYGNYSFEMPYEWPYQITPLMKKNSAFVISFTPKNMEYEYRATFPTTSLVSALEKIQESCK